MKDLDFDELDRAVASAIGDKPADESTAQDTSSVATPGVGVAEQPAVSPAAPRSISAHAIHSRIMPSAISPLRTTLQRKSVMETDEVQVSEPSPPPVAPSGSQTSDPVSTPATRRIPHREGKFMDVVRPGHAVGAVVPKQQIAHDSPSHEQELDEPLAEPETNVHLEAAIHELLVSEGHEPVQTNSGEHDTDQLHTDTDATHEPASDEPPKDVDEVSQTPEDVAAPAGDMPLEAIAAELATSGESNAIEEPVASPFLSDAKVEKRPLGMNSDATDTPHDNVQSTDADTPKPNAKSDEMGTPAPETEATPIPEELASDLVAIESVASDTTPEQVTPTSAASKTPVSAGPASIARQYKEPPRTASDDDESGAIFDPQTYQQPIEHPAKKSSGWIWVVVIILIILLAVGGAVAAWFGGLLPVAL